MTLGLESIESDKAVSANIARTGRNFIKIANAIDGGGNVDVKIGEHNTSGTAHADIRGQIDNLDALITVVYDGSVSLDAKNTVIENWNSMSVGTSICRLQQGDVKSAYVLKVNDSYGSIVITGYHPNVANPIYGRLNNGTWDWTDVLTTTPKDWISATLQNLWVNATDDFEKAGFYKDNLGIVRLKGLIQGGIITANTILLTLPVGYRPNKNIILLCPNNSTIATIQANVDGTISCVNVSNNVWLSLENISFRVV